MILIELLQLCSLEHEASLAIYMDTQTMENFLSNESSLHRFSKLDKTTSLESRVRT